MLKRTYHELSRRRGVLLSTQAPKKFSVGMFYIKHQLDRWSARIMRRFTGNILVVLVPRSVLQKLSYRLMLLALKSEAWDGRQCFSTRNTPWNHPATPFPVLACFESSVSGDQFLQHGVQLILGAHAKTEPVHESDEALWQQIYLYPNN